MKLKDILVESAYELIDNKSGLGSVPYNQEVDYMGLRVFVTPDVFLSLASPLSVINHEKVDFIIDHLDNGGKIGAPFFQIKFPADWEDDQFDEDAKIVGHEGRHRMLAIKQLHGNIPVETHLFFSGGVRNRDLTPLIISQLNEKILNQKGRLIKGPWFNK